VINTDQNTQQFC